MKDAFERRALLLQLGRTLQLLARILESRTTAATVGEFIALNPLLEDEPLLEHVLPSMSVDDFVAQAAQAFCTWPARLLDETLERDAFAASVREHLFDQNPGGWRAYAAGLRGELAWFGQRPSGQRRVPHRRPSRASEPAPTEAAASGAAASPAAVRDIEREERDEGDEGTAQRISESVEGLAPPESAQRGNEQSLPEFE
ncbi:hypothetical protein [Paraburkholderia sacchari]|uniref:Uncharacterized protein n=1 Tax=Paraburkholderia sacchari TaxID=159450 RepID=A0A8T6ZK34_9BURK|nr:hypothetical protein [Paraburkholderia sacchari]NLP64614.1 hypothetical protein [Paraburkholderia sacchari]